MCRGVAAGAPVGGSRQRTQLDGAHCPTGRLPPASVASRYALGADGVGAARPGACGGARLIHSRLAAFALGVWRSALGAEVAVLCAGRGQPTAAIAASRSALGAEVVGAARPGASAA